MFPYRLRLRNATTGQINTGGAVEGGEKYGLALEASTGALDRGVERRYVYVFALDAFGNATLLFPRVTAGNVENRVPYESADSGAGFPTQIQLGRPHLFTVGPPYGVDTYVLLSTAHPIPDPGVLQFKGVRVRGASAPADDPLTRLLRTVGSTTRGEGSVAPADWSIDRLSVRSSPTPR